MFDYQRFVFHVETYSLFVSIRLRSFENAFNTWSSWDFGGWWFECVNKENNSAIVRRTSWDEVSSFFPDFSCSLNDRKDDIKEAVNSYLSVMDAVSNSQKNKNVICILCFYNNRVIMELKKIIRILLKQQMEQKKRMMKVHAFIVISL